MDVLCKVFSFVSICLFLAVDTPLTLTVVRVTRGRALSLRGKETLFFPFMPTLPDFLPSVMRTLGGSWCLGLGFITNIAECVRIGSLWQFTTGARVFIRRGLL